MKNHYFIAGGAGFIGSAMAHRLLEKDKTCFVTIYDNLSSGSMELIDDIKNHYRVRIIIDDIKNLSSLISAMQGATIVYHFASNADIAKAIADPTIDFYEGTLLTQNILEAMRINKVSKIVYASGSGVYGLTGNSLVSETYSPCIPISPYGASKLAGEALISAYCYMFGMRGVVYRFANVVGGKSTHGVIKDFVSKLRSNPKELEILGNGEQVKGYIYLYDVLEGIFSTENGNLPFDFFNLAPDSQSTVKEIANEVVKQMGLSDVSYKYTSNEQRGWKGDVGEIRLTSDKAKSYGWNPKFKTSQEAISKAIFETISGGI